MVAKSAETGKKVSNVKSKNSSGKQKGRKPSKSCFAAIVPANISLVYLKRSLLQELAKVPVCFHEKVVGSFVRIKSHLNARSHQLLQVKGITNLDSEFHLRLSNYTGDVPLHLLSDGNFTEEECDDVHERVKAGTLRGLTVVDLEAKAKLLHKDITEHSLSWELSMLQLLLDQANEKGWREKKEAYLLKKQELQEPDELETRLSQTPKVIGGAMDYDAIFWMNVHGFDVDTPKWHYFDPKGDIHGPFPLTPLKIWYSMEYFAEDAIIWKTGQNPNDDGLRMSDVLCSAFDIE